MSPEERAREEIDRLLTAAGWSVADVAQGDLRAGRGVTVRAYGPQRARCGWQLDDCFECEPKELNSTVRTRDQIRGITRMLRDYWRRDLLLQREVLFKTPAFAEFDNQVGAIVEIPRTESAQKFNHCTADLPAAGTDIKIEAPSNG